MVLFDFEICNFRKFFLFAMGCNFEYLFDGFLKGYSLILDFLFLEGVYF
jgi:hypothetical protein